MKPLIVFLLLFSFVPLLGSSVAAQSSVQSVTIPVPLAANVTSMSTTTRMVTESSTSTSLIVQTITVQTTSYQTTLMQTLNASTTVTGTSTYWSTLLIPVPVTVTNTIVSNITSVNVIVVPHFQSEFLTSDILALLNGALVIFLSCVAAVIIYARRKHVQRRNGTRFK